jgi:hypothetical protein
MQTHSGDVPVPKLRLPIHGRRGGRWLALGVATAVLVLPGVAHADPALDPGGVVPPATVPGPVGDVLGQLGDQTPQGNGTPTDPSGSSSQQQQATPQEGTPAPPTLPPQLQQLLDKLKDQQPNPACSAAIQADLTKLLTDVPALITAIVTDLLDQLSNPQPPDPQDLLGQLQDLLGQLQGQQPGQQQAAPAADSPSPDPTVILADLQQLVTDLTTNCAPAPPTQTPPPPPPPANQPPPVQAAAPPPPAQPVVYPGYAPTGSLATPALRPASDQRSSEPVPLSVLGGVLLGSAAAAVGMRSRARRAGR